MTRSRRWSIGAVAALATLAALGTSGSVAHPGEEPPPPPAPNADGRYLPDLVQILPPRVGVAFRSSSLGRRTLLTFSSAMENHGAGPLIVRTASGNAPDGTLTANQLVSRSDGRRERLAPALRLRYVRGGGHSHFHLQDFARYELRTVGGESLRRDRKTGFCLGDRYDYTGSARIAGEPARAIYRSQCGRDRPTLTALTEGISVGFGDIYPARVEGQYIDVTGLPSGRYVLVLRTDPENLLLDMHDDNDASSVLVKLVQGSRPHARILSWCSGRVSCPTPGVHGRR